MSLIDLNYQTSSVRDWSGLLLPERWPVFSNPPKTDLSVGH